MPLISGALWKNNDSRSIELINNLIHNTTNELETKQEIIFNKERGFLIIAGKKEIESSAEKVIRLKNDTGLLIGRLFENNSGNQARDLGLSLNDLIADPEKLSKNYWGRYILSIFNQDEKTITLFRDPLGLTTLYIAKTLGGIIFSSKLSIIYDSLLDKPSINWNYLTSYVAYPHFPTLTTPFNDIFELSAGHFIMLSEDSFTEQKPFWFPVNDSSYANQNDYEEKIIPILENCTRAWSNNASNIYVELSGGIDSSSVLMILKQIAPDNVTLTGVNFYHPLIASSNEIIHARKVAASCAIDLQLIDLSDHLLLTKLPNYRTCKPSSFLLNCSADEAIAAYTKGSNNNEIMTGQGGDHLFMCPPSIDSVTDYFLEKGVNGITKKIKDISAYYRMPLVQVLGKSIQSLAKYYTGSNSYLQKPIVSSWMQKSFKEKLDARIFRSTFLDKLKDLNPAKAQHVFSIYQAIMYIDRGHKLENKPSIDPLLSQPLVELALSIPTYEMYGDGNDRIPFRRAFFNYTKNDYIWRKTKGETSGIVSLSFQHNIKTVKELALEGRFAQENLINKELLFAEIMKIQHGSCENAWPIANLLAAEVWLNAWKI